jgi:hypothetical protein
MGFAFLLVPILNFGQAPNLGTTSGFAVYTAAGTLDNSGTSNVTGNIGTNTTSVTGFPPGTILGTIYQTGDPAAVQAATDVASAYADLSATTCGSVIGTTLGSGQILTPDIYCLGSTSILNGNLTLDALGDPNALFIIKINGAFSTALNTNIILANSASLCNVYWQVNGAFSLGDGSVFKGTLIANGSISLLEGASVEGRTLSIAGAVDLHNNIVSFSPSTAPAITGTASVCENQTGVVYSVPAIHNATDYVWTLPAGASITAGLNTNNITVSFSMGASSGNITVQGTSTCGSGIVSPNFAVIVTLRPLTSLIFHQ